jgi:hypothetical protein
MAALASAIYGKERKARGCVSEASIPRRTDISMELGASDRLVSSSLGPFHVVLRTIRRLVVVPIHVLQRSLTLAPACHLLQVLHRRFVIGLELVVATFPNAA